MEFKRFMDELSKDLHKHGMAMMEDQLLILSKVFFDHMGKFDYENDIMKAVMPIAANQLRHLVDEQLEKIDPTDNVGPLD